MVHPLSGAGACGCCEGWHSPHTPAPHPSHSTAPAPLGAGYRCPHWDVCISAAGYSAWGRTRRRCWAHGWRWTALPQTPPCTRGTFCWTASSSAGIPDRRCECRAAAPGPGRCPDTQDRWGPAGEVKAPLTCLHPYSQPWFHGPSAVCFRF